MGDTIESQQNEENKELEEFLSTDNEFKSETEGPTNATDDPMAKYFALGNLFVTFLKKARVFIIQKIIQIKMNERES